jgi:hypothetical protein
MYVQQHPNYVTCCVDGWGHYSALPLGQYRFGYCPTGGPPQPRSTYKKCVWLKRAYLPLMSTTSWRHASSPRVRQSGQMQKQARKARDTVYGARCPMQRHAAGPRRHLPLVLVGARAYPSWHSGGSVRADRSHVLIKEMLMQAKRTHPLLPHGWRSECVTSGVNKDAGA